MVERSNPSWGPRWLEVPILGEMRFPSGLQQERSFQAGAISSPALGMAKVVEQKGPVLQLEEAKAHPKEGMYLPLAFIDVNVKELVENGENPKMVSCVPKVGIPIVRELACVAQFFLARNAYR